MSFEEMLILWDLNNKQYNYSKSLAATLGLFQTAIDNSMMVADVLKVVNGITKDVFDVVGNASTVVGLITSLLPDPDSEKKAKWDSFIVSYVQYNNGNISSEVKDIIMEVSYSYNYEGSQSYMMGGLKPVTDHYTEVTRTTKLYFYNTKTKKDISVILKEESWPENIR